LHPVPNTTNIYVVNNDNSFNFIYTLSNISTTLEIVMINVKRF